MDAAQLLTFLSPTQMRRLRVIENLLTGKRTVSTLYWSMRYQLLDWLGYDKQLARDEMDQLVGELQQAGWITLTSSQAVLTKAGQVQQQKVLATTYQPRALAVQQTVDVATFWQRFLLATQVVSEQRYHNRHYYPLQVSWQVKRTIKSWYKLVYNPELAMEFNTVLTAFLTRLPETQANFFSQLLIGHDFPGQTMLQLAAQFQLSASEARLMTTDLICQLVQFLQQADESSVKVLLRGLATPPITSSAVKTLQSFQAGQSLTAISHQRQLKLSTVREHLLEAAIMLPLAQFPYDRLIPASLVDSVTERLADVALDNWQFQQVSELQIEFWQFRLVEILRSKQEDDQ